MPSVKIAKESHDHSIGEEHEHYPYGTSLSFDDELVESLNLDKMDVGDTVEVKAIAKIISKSEDDSEDHSSKSVRLQLTEVDIYPQQPDNAETLYGEG